MSIGNSGRIVLEVDPDMKRRLYAALAGNGLTLKAWFIQEASAYINNAGQGELFTKKDLEIEPQGGLSRRASDVAA